MRWYLSRGAQTEGPLDEAALLDAIRRGEVPPTAQVCAEGTQTWKPLLAVPELAMAVASAKPSGVAPTMALSVEQLMSPSSPGMLGSLSGASQPTPPQPTPQPTPPQPTPPRPTPPQPTPPGTTPPQVTPPQGHLATPAPVSGQTPIAPPVAGPPSSPYAATPTPAPMASGHQSSPAAFAPTQGFAAPPAPAPSYPGQPSSPGSYQPVTPPPGSGPAAFAPPGQPSPFGSAPGATPASGSKSRAPLLVGAGCAVILLASLCIGGGIALYFSLHADPFPSRVEKVAEVIRAVAVDGHHEDASQWTCVSGADLMSSPAETRAAMAQLGGHPEIVLTALDLVAVQGSYSVQALVLVFPDGRVRYSSVRAQPLFDYIQQPTAWNTGRERDTELLAGVDALLEQLSQDPCDVDWIASGELEGIPTELVGEIMQGVSVPDLTQACNTVTTTDGWQRSVGGVSVIVQGNGHTAVLNTALSQLPGTSVCLAPITARVMEDAPTGAVTP
ncbi:MAG: GYF domain-containing protein [Sandaracinaceae bacterium]